MTPPLHERHDGHPDHGRPATPDPGADAGRMLGLDFLHQHRIRYTAWDLGVHSYMPGPMRLWALRIERDARDGGVRAWAWTRTTGPAATDPDWDEGIFLKSRDARDGRLSFDGFMDENLFSGPSIMVSRGEYEDWVEATVTWQEARSFLDGDHDLITAFLSIVPNEDCQPARIR